MKNIWIINQYATPPKYGSIVRHHNLSKYMDKSKYNVYIISSSAIHNSTINLIEGKEKYKISNIDGVNYVHIKTSQYNGNGIKRILNILQFYINTKSLAKKIILETGKPDVVYASSPMPTTAILGIELAKKTKAENIIEIRDLWPDSVVSFGVAGKKNILVKILYLIEKIMYLKADKLVFTMPGGKEYMETKKYKNKIDFSKIYNINNGVDLSQYDYNKDNFSIEDDEELNDRSTFKLLYTGGIRKAYNLKDVLDLGDMIQKNGYKDVKIFLYGNGNEKEEMINYCKEKNINNIIFRDFIDNKYVPDIMSKCNICLLQGKNVDIFKYGTSQNKMFAYLYSGNPIISCFYNKYDLIEKSGCGITLKENTIEEYYNAFKQIYETYGEKKEEYKQNCKKLLNEFDYKVLSKKLENLI